MPRVPCSCFRADELAEHCAALAADPWHSGVARQSWSASLPVAALFVERMREGKVNRLLLCSVSRSTNALARTRVRHFTAGFQVPDRQRGDKCFGDPSPRRRRCLAHLQSPSKGSFAAMPSPSSCFTLTSAGLGTAPPSPSCPPVGRHPIASSLPSWRALNEMPDLTDAAIVLVEPLADTPSGSTAKKTPRAKSGSRPPTACRASTAA